jgi:hypothetical protein
MLIPLLLALADQDSPADLAGAEAQIAFLVGDWCTEGVDRQTCEHWEPMRGGMMLGTSQTIRGGKTVAFEFMRIVREPGGWAFYGAPGGKPAVRFAHRPGSWTMAAEFAAPEHDYPRLIRYERAGDRLVATISGAEAEKDQMRWNYARVSR